MKKPIALVIPFNGKSKSIYNWAKELGMCQQQILRKFRLGFPIEKCFDKSIVVKLPGNVEPEYIEDTDEGISHKSLRKVITLTHEGVTKTIGQWAQTLSISRTTIKSRHSRDWSVEECLFGKKGQL